MAPLPHGKQIQTPINSAFGATTGRAAKQTGGLDVLEAFSMKKPRVYFGDPVVHTTRSLHLTSCTSTMVGMPNIDDAQGELKPSGSADNRVGGG